MQGLDLYSVDMTGVPRVRPCGCNQGNENDESCVLMSAIPGHPGAVALSDSKHPERGDLRFTPQEFTEFLRGVTEHRSGIDG